MDKQKKQLLLLLPVLIIAIVALVLVLRMPEEEEAEDITTYTVTDLGAENVTKLVFTNETGTFTLTKQEDTWTYEEFPDIDLDEDAVNAMVSQVASLSSENCIEKVTDLIPYGLREPAITILVSDGTTSDTILVGDYNDITATQYICLESDKETIYTTTMETVEPFAYSIDSVIAAEEETTEVVAE